VFPARFVASRPARWRTLLAPLALLTTAPAISGPWIAPGDEGLRSDILMLADAGILRGPVTTWPLSWPDVARDALGASQEGLDDATLGALLRVQRRARSESNSGLPDLELRASAAHAPTSLRTFADSPRDAGELSARASWLTDHLALNLQATVVVDPDDGKKLRADGSYLGVSVGNFMLSAGYMERWWGPGWDGSLILSTNARPIPSVTLERNYTDPFESKLLSWIGPWRASIAIGEAEAHDVAIPEVRFLAARVNFKPRQWLEVGVSRTAQWCGGERQCDWSTFADMLLGRDNQDVGGSTDDQPGNQMAGYDLRLRSPWRALPLAFYTQWIGEDEAGGLPAKFLGLFGVEGWGGGRFGAVRVRLEYADTACMFTSDEPQFGCGYRNSIYPQGYTYRRRVIGHAMDNDSRMLTLGAILTGSGGDVVSLAIRRVELNRDGGPHSISDAPLTLDNVELRYSRVFGMGKVIAGIGCDDRGPVGDPGSKVRGFITWQQGF
jgi:hypothetical protein